MVDCQVPVDEGVDGRIAAEAPTDPRQLDERRVCALATGGRPRPLECHDYQVAGHQLTVERCDLDEARG